jgi:hypothetical protein
MVHSILLRRIDSVIAPSQSMRHQPEIDRIGQFSLDTGGPLQNLNHISKLTIYCQDAIAPVEPASEIPYIRTSSASALQRAIRDQNNTTTGGMISGRSNAISPDIETSVRTVSMLRQCASASAVRGIAGLSGANADSFELLDFGAATHEIMPKYRQ